MNQLASQQPVDQQRDTEQRVQGLSMPAYHGHLNESIGLYIHRVKVFYMAKNYEQNEVVEARCLAMELASRRVNGGSKTLVDFEQTLREEFEPVDLQERLRDRLFTLQQRWCRNLFEYVEKFRRVCTDVQEMSELDKVTFFTRSLKLETQEEVKYRQCKMLTSAIKVALEYEWAHVVALSQRHDKSIR
ncbi:hypothetical protein AaE_004008, partial [Aphanomyces astaci]